MEGSGPATFEACGPWPVQLRHHTKLTSEDYVTQKAWRLASLERCPLHPRGGCGFARHGTYQRVEPPGMRVARCYCPRARQSFSLLPDCLSSRLVGSLDEAEQVVLRVEASRSVEQAAASLRPDIELPGAVRWVRRRLKGVRAALVALLTLLPGELGAAAELGALRELLGSERVLADLREIAHGHLGALPRPVGFGPAPLRVIKPGQPLQHKEGPDPPQAPGV